MSTHVSASVLSVQGSFSPPSDQALLPRITSTRPPTCPLCRASLLWAVAQLPATSALFAENISTKKEFPGAVGGHARPRANDASQAQPWEVWGTPAFAEGAEGQGVGCKHKEQTPELHTPQPSLDQHIIAAQAGDRAIRDRCFLLAAPQASQGQ